MAKIKDMPKKDLYLILGVEDTANDKEIVRGYRKKALKCHPDKNPDNPKAAEEFFELSLALEVLTDAAARAAYDHSRKAKKEVEARNKVLDSKRKKFKEDLEAREQAAESNKVSQVDAEKKLKLEIERLRKEGSRLLEQEKIRLQKLLKTPEKETVEDHNEDVPRMKLKWKAAKGDPANGGYNDMILSNIFSCYGNISTLLVSGKRNGSAIVEFKPSGVSSDILDETGLADNPLSIVWLSGKPTVDSNDSFIINHNVNTSNGLDLANNGESSVSFVSSDPINKNTSGNIFGTAFPGGNEGSSRVGGQQSYSSDFESLVLRNMRQAEERKRLMEQMAKDDEENG